MRLKNIVAVVAIASVVGNAQAALFDRGGGLLYDDVLKVTWLQDASYAKTIGLGSGGLMNWATANSWVAGLVYHDSVRNVDHSDWRLPMMIDTGAPGEQCTNSGTDCGYNVQTYDGVTGKVYSEMAHMYYNNLGLKGTFSPSGSYQPDFGIFGNGTYNGSSFAPHGQNNVGLVRNLQAYIYWSSLEYAPDTSLAWNFFMNVGTQRSDLKNAHYFYAWAVRDGDVASPVAAPIPEPETYAMMLAGLGLLGLTARRRRHKLNA
jgi:hypothetical protein